MSITESVVQQHLYRIAPDIDLSQIDINADIREEYDIDSMDYLHLIIALGKHFDIVIPEADYPKISSFNSLCRYLEEGAAV